MTTLRRVSLSALCAPLCLLAGCRGDFVIDTPTPGQTVAQSTRIAFTADHAWRLVSVKFDTDPLNYKDRFKTATGYPSAGSGPGKDQQHADIFLSTGTHTVVVEMMVDRYGGETGRDSHVHEVTFTVEPNRVDLVVDLPENREDPALFEQPIKVHATPNFVWKDIKVVTSTTDTSTPADRTSRFSPGIGNAGQEFSGTLSLAAPQNYRIKASATPLTEPALTAISRETVVHLVTTGSPLCVSPQACVAVSSPSSFTPDATVNVAVGSALGFTCGGGTWGYVADTHQGRCEQVGRAPSPAAPTADWVRVPVKDTVCSSPGDRKFVDGNVACVLRSSNSVP